MRFANYQRCYVKRLTRGGGLGFKTRPPQRVLTLHLEQLEQRTMLAISPVALLPDLTPWVSQSKGFMYDWTIQGNDLRLTTAMANIGTGRMELRGGATQSQTQQVHQRVYEPNGSYTDVLAGQFTYHPEHEHIHFDEFAEFRLREVLPGDGVGSVVATGDKVSFCLIDVERYDNSGPSSPYFLSCAQSQGISAGWADVYDRGLPGQSIEITNVPDGNYWLEAEVDPGNHLLESDETNNVARIQIALVRSGGGSVIAPDTFEPNNSFAAASILAPPQDHSYSGLSIHASLNDDWYRVTASASGPMSFGVAFQHSQGDIEMEVYNASFTRLDFSDSQTNSEQVSVNAAAGAYYYVRVFGYEGATSPNYTFSVDQPLGGSGPNGDLFENNDSFATASSLAAIDQTYTSLSIDASGDDDYYSLVPAASGTMVVSLSFLHSAGDIDLRVFNASQTRLAQSDSTGNTEQVSVPVTAGQTYYIRAYGFGGAINPDYSMAIDVPGSAGGPLATINQATTQADPTSASPIHFTVVFSQPVFGFATGDVALTGSARATTATVTGSGTTYDVEVSGMTGSGTVIASIGAGVAANAAGNPNAASTSSDNTVTFDNGQPIGSFADSFEVSEWNGLWVEDSQNDWTLSTQRATAGTRSAEVDGSASDATLTTANGIDLSGPAPATLIFDWLIESGFDSGEYLTLDISTNGGSTWISDVRRLNGNASPEDVWHSEIVDLAPYASSNLKFRFRSRVSASDEEANVDNVQIVRIAASELPTTASFQTGVFPTASYDGTADTAIRSGNATTNYGTANTVELDGSPDISTLIKWDLTSIPAGSLVTSVTMVLNVTNASAASSVYNLYQMLRPWSEAQATFNVYATGQAWQSAGAQGAADRGTTVLGTVTSTSTGVKTFNLNSAGVAVVQNWIQNPGQNNGFVVQNYANAAADNLVFRSRQASTATQRPKLTVVHSQPITPALTFGRLSTAQTLASPIDIHRATGALPRNALIEIENPNRGDQVRSPAGLIPESPVIPAESKTESLRPHPRSNTPLARIREYLLPIESVDRRSAVEAIFSEWPGDHL